MAFRHLAMRVTNTREYGEPPNGEHHHAYDPQVFAAALSRVFVAKGLQFRHPFSFYVGRVRHPLVVAMANWFDEWLDHRAGQEFYYAAFKNFADAADVAEYVQRELDTRPEIDKVQFMALLQQAASILERELADEIARTHNVRE
jgi:hypothetical protein